VSAPDGRVLHEVRVPAAGTLTAGTYRCVCGEEHPYGSRPHNPEDVARLLVDRGRQV
jgi:hypothetical protein